MFKNYLKVALRNLLKQKAYSLITIIGLGIGLAATLLILLYIRFESSYDTFHRQAQSLFRVSVVYKKEGRVEFDGPQFTPPIGPAMLQEFPEVENYVRLSSAETSLCSPSCARKPEPRHST